MKYPLSIYANAANVMTWEMFRNMLRCTRKPEINQEDEMVYIIALDINGYKRHLFYSFEEIEKYIDKLGDEQNEKIGQSQQENNSSDISEKDIRIWKEIDRIWKRIEEVQKAIYIYTDSIKEAEENNSIEEAIFHTFTGDSYH